MVGNFSRILVAGGAGFIGSHIVDRLMKEGMEVVVLDNFHTGKLENINGHRVHKNFQLIRGDVRNFNLVKRAVKDVDAVFNEAAVVGTSYCIKDPIMANEVNVSGTLNLLTACLNSQVKRFVQASSASIYGNSKSPVSETSPPDPTSPYAVSELAAESYVRVFNKEDGLETVCLRYFIVYGPRQIVSPWSGVIAIFFNQLLRNRRPIVFGDGKQTRDFVYVKDIVEASMLALTTEKAKGEVFNIATGVPSTINEVVRILQEDMCKQYLKPIHKPPRSGDVRYSYASIEKANRILGYKPTRSLRKGIVELIESHSIRKV